MTSQLDNNENTIYDEDDKKLSGGGIIQEHPWLIGLICIGVGLLVGVIVYLIVTFAPKRKKNDNNKEGYQAPGVEEFNFGRGDNPEDFDYANSWIDSILGSTSKVSL